MFQRYSLRFIRRPQIVIFLRSRRNSQILKSGIRERKPKRRVALWLSYRGTGFLGLQKNHISDSTLEHELEKAVSSAGLVSEANAGDQKKVGWNRSSRTDKGVHSLKTVISIKLEHDWKRSKSDHNYVYDVLDQCKDLPNLINPHLPFDAMRVIAARPVWRNWNSRRMTKGRTYYYLLPKSIVADTWLCTDKPRAISVLNKFVGRAHWHNFCGSIRDYNKTKQERVSRAAKGDPTLKPSVISFLNQVQNSEREIGSPLDRAIAGPRFSELSSWISRKIHELYRSIYEVNFDETNINGRSYIRLKITGESFVLHQIRKIVGSILLVTKGIIREELLELMIRSPFHFNVPIAPPQGLLLYGGLSLESKGNSKELFVLTDEERDRLLDFEYQVLYPHIDQLMLDEGKFAFDSVVEILPKFKIDDEDEVLALWNVYKATLETRGSLRKLFEEEEGNEDYQGREKEI